MVTRQRAMRDMARQKAKGLVNSSKDRSEKPYMPRTMEFSTVRGVRQTGSAVCWMSRHLSRVVRMSPFKVGNRDMTQYVSSDPFPSESRPDRVGWITINEVRR